MANNLPPLLYVLSGVLFILALRGLSSPVTARQGNRYGMIGMALAAATTLFVLQDKGLVTWAIAGAAVALASVNIFGGFFVTQRMLGRYKKKES